MVMRRCLILSVLMFSAILAQSQGGCDGQQGMKARVGDVNLASLVAPSTVLYQGEKPLSFALYGLIEFKTVAEMLAYVDEQTGRWKFPTTEARQQFADDLMRRGVESRIVSMTTEKPLEILLTHTPEELQSA